MNILFLSIAPWAPTGYGTQVAQASKRMLEAGHNVAISAQAGLQWAQFEWQGIHVYPSDYTRLNKRLLRYQAMDWAERCECELSDVQVISLFDIWPWVDPSPAYGGMMADFKGLRIASWLPVDTYPLAPKTAYALEQYDVRPIAMSRFGETTLQEAGFDPLYVPHAIDTQVYKPQDDRASCKEMLGIDPEKFVIGMVAHNEGMNPARKAFPNVLQAFAAFNREHPDSVLYLHTEVTGTAWGGLNLLGMAREAFGIPEDAITFVQQIPYLSGAIPPPLMAPIYSALDVLANPSYSEGFGLPIIEAQSCGTPVITSGWTAMPEITGAGWQVGGQPFYHEAAGAMWLHPSTEELVKAFELAYEHRGDDVLRQKARQFALGYDSETVYGEHWVPVLEALDAPREIPPLKPVAKAA